ncbi:Conserved_hypothetical protein [Hexamita inflata]|uniref:Transmembrane protein n=1 Tax=Hexamita inflata TaxID=28002 RepID=A0ABP1KPV3_9EUKA
MIQLLNQVLLVINPPVMNNISGCYSPKTTAEYRRNLNQLVVTLISASNPNCSVFPRQVDVNATFAELSQLNAVIPPFTITVKDFNYSTTKQIVFKNVPDLSTYDIQNILIEIYSFQEITQVQIFNMQESRSSLTQCFYPNTSISIGITGFHLNVTATGLCKIQINTMVQMDIVISNTIKSFYTISNTDLNDLKLNYDADLFFQLFFPGDFTSFWNTQSAQARIYITGSTSSIRFDFGSVSYDSFPDIYSNVFVTASDEMFCVLGFPDPVKMAPYQTKVTSLGTYDTFVIRVNWINQNYTIQKTIRTAIFSNIYQEFKCENEPDSVAKALCQKVYKAVKANETQSVQLEFLVIKSENPIFVQKTKMTYYRSPVESLLLQQNSKTIDLDVVYYGPTAPSDTYDITIMTWTFTMANPPAANANPVTGVATWSSSTKSMSISCPDTNANCKLAKVIYPPIDSIILVTYASRSTGKTYCQFVIGVTKNDFKTVKAVTIAISVVIIIGLLVYVIISILRFKQSIKVMKKKKNG